MNYHHLTIEERCCIREFYKKGLSYRKIAELIGRSPSTVSREINRNRTHCMTFQPIILTQHRRSTFCVVPIVTEECFIHKRLFPTLKKNFLLHGRRNRLPAHPRLYQCPAGVQSIGGSMTDICSTETQRYCAAKGNLTAQKKHGVNSARVNLYARGIRACTAVRKPDIGKWILLLVDTERVRRVLRPLQRERHATT